MVEQKCQPDREVFSRSCVTEQDGKLQLDEELVFDPRVVGFSGQEKICIKRTGKETWKVNYQFGVVRLSDNTAALNEIESRLRKYWHIGAANIVVRECSSIAGVLFCIAYKEAYFEAYAEKRSETIDDAASAAAFMDHVEKKLNEKKEDLHYNPSSDAESMGLKQVIDLKRILIGLKFEAMDPGL